ncbi:MAG TPA: alpha-amylase family glycosyl hydrolase [Saprospiraceae bacterium]|nr:alpha-amylase family glycosyl hydrolase [Saprospiraceae bacterium]
MRRSLLFFALLALLSCNKNYFGNPHPLPTASRTVPAVPPGDLRVEPANWWTGMKYKRIEVLIHYPDLASYTCKMGQTKGGIKMLGAKRLESPNYQIVSLEIGPKAPAQRVPLVFTKGNQQFTHEFPVLARNTSPKAQGVSSRDVVYLIFPDRFANGDPGNDSVEGMLEKADRSQVRGRHGGDFKGIRDHLDYLQDLGITTIWLNPELENDQISDSFHGYALTDHYRADRRFGSNQELRDLIAECHKRGIKVVRDVVFNHIGDGHYWMKDLPAKDWINQWPTFTRSNFRAPTLVDPYASAADRKLFQEGWFDTRMPDVNQRNPHVANYLIQQTIWWMEWAGFDDFRIDTYTYSDQDFCSRWCATLRDEYPRLNMFGEIWEHGVPVQGFFADNQPMRRAQFDSNLPGVIDFQIMFAMHDALNKEQAWTEGVTRLYYVLAQDYFYEDPMRNLIMLDNHDFTRIYSTVGEDMDKYKSAIAMLLTLRGIPQLYYLTELAAPGTTSPHDGFVRQDFPGGWPTDPANKFTREGRTARENEAFDYVRSLLRYRNTSTALQTGRLMQFVPTDGVYTYFRYDDRQTVMVVVNTSGKDVDIKTERFAERMQGFSHATEVATGQRVPDISHLSIQKHTARVLQLER